MRAGHVLLALPAAMAVGGQLYVELEWDYRDAPGDVKAALLMAGLGLLAAALLGIPLLRRR